MPPTAPNSQLLIKGALIAYDSPVIGAVPNVIPFQFNPNELRRSLEERGFQISRESRSETVDARRRVKGPPSEAIDLTIRLDASSLDLSVLNAGAGAFGVQPALSALEMPLYPNDGTARIDRQPADARAGAATGAKAAGSAKSGTGNESTESDGQGALQTAEEAVLAYQSTAAFPKFGAPASAGDFYEASPSCTGVPKSSHSHHSSQDHGTSQRSSETR